MIGTTVSHYKILQEIGEGGMGEVFLAEGRLARLLLAPTRIDARKRT